ncbi:MAG: hypothetical protein RI897_2346 [Verrucomicrobiota bacterium]
MVVAAEEAGDEHEEETESEAGAYSGEEERGDGDTAA